VSVRSSARMMGTIGTIVAASALVAAPASGGADDPPVHPRIPFDERAAQGAMERATAHSRERRSAAAEDRRRRSRSAHRDLGRAAALRLAHDRHPKLLGRPLGAQLKLRPGQRVVRYLGASSALVDLGDRSTVVASTVPLAVPDGEGWAPADLDLVPDGTGFAVQRPLVAARVARHAGRAATIGEGGIAVTPLVGATSSEPALDDGRLFWADAATDTDVRPAGPGGSRGRVHAA